jgi:acyl carrier protein
MNNFEKYNAAFCAVFNIKEENLNEDFSSVSVDNWDSINQLSLVTAVEDAFDIMLDPEDILEFKSYKIGKEIILKYGVSV